MSPTKPSLFHLHLSSDASTKEEFCSLEISVGDSAHKNNADAFHKEWKDVCMKSDHPNTLVCPDKGVLKIEDEEYKDVAKDVKDLAKAAKYEILFINKLRKDILLT